MREALSLIRSVCWMIPMLVGITSVMGFLSLLSSLFDSTGRLQHRVASNWGRMLMTVFMVRVRLTGAENLAPDHAYVFASNHFSLIDTPLMFGFMPRPFRILARSGLWKIPFIGWHLNRAGHLPVHRENPRLAARNIAFAAEKVRDGRSILVFPEGGRPPRHEHAKAQDGRGAHRHPIGSFAGAGGDLRNRARAAPGLAAFAARTRGCALWQAAADREFRPVDCARADRPLAERNRATCGCTAAEGWRESGERGN